MEQHVVKLRSVVKLTHDVLELKTDKPSHYLFEPGQATDLAINKKGWAEEKRPFTFTSLPADDYLSFVIKTYPDHHGVTGELLQLQVGEELILHDVYGTIAYKGEGVFIAGGAGVTPFIAIFRHLKVQGKLGRNKLIFANKTAADIILEREFKALLGECFINILSDENRASYAHGYITASFLAPHLNGKNQKFYICGPQPMMDAVEEQLASLGVAGDAVVKEVF